MIVNHINFKTLSKKHSLNSIHPEVQRCNSCHKSFYLLYQCVAIFLVKLCYDSHPAQHKEFLSLTTTNQLQPVLEKKRLIYLASESTATPKKASQVKLKIMLILFSVKKKNNLTCLNEQRCRNIANMILKSRFCKYSVIIIVPCRSLFWIHSLADTFLWFVFRPDISIDFLLMCVASKKFRSLKMEITEMRVKRLKTSDYFHMLSISNQNEKPKND